MLQKDNCICLFINLAIQGRKTPKPLWFGSFWSQDSFNNKNTRSEWSGCFYGASDLTRTGDLLITSEMHYRLCYTSINCFKPSYYTHFLVVCQLFFNLI